MTIRAGSLYLLLILIICGAAIAEAESASSGNFVEIVLVDGTTVRGVEIDVNVNSVVVRTEMMGDVTILRSKISSIKYGKEVIDEPAAEPVSAPRSGAPVVNSGVPQKKKESSGGQFNVGLDLFTHLGLLYGRFADPEHDVSIDPGVLFGGHLGYFSPNFYFGLGLAYGTFAFEVEKIDFDVTIFRTELQLAFQAPMFNEHLYPFGGLALGYDFADFILEYKDYYGHTKTSTEQGGFMNISLFAGIKYFFVDYVGVSGGLRIDYYTLVVDPDGSLGDEDFDFMPISLFLSVETKFGGGSD